MSDEESLTLKERVDRAVAVGTPPEVLKVLFPGWADNEAHKNLETSIRQDMGLEPETKTEPTSGNWGLEDEVRYNMEHPPPPYDPLEDRSLTLEDRVRKKDGLPSVEAVE